jgi:hypothetical protein
MPPDTYTPFAMTIGSMTTPLSLRTGCTLYANSSCCCVTPVPCRLYCLCLREEEEKEDEEEDEDEEDDDDDDPVRAFFFGREEESFPLIGTFSYPFCCSPNFVAGK